MSTHDSPTVTTRLLGGGFFSVATLCGALSNGQHVARPTSSRLSHFTRGMAHAYSDQIALRVLLTSSATTTIDDRQLLQLLVYKSAHLQYLLFCVALEWFDLQSEYYSPGSPTACSSCATNSPKASLDGTASCRR
eukprot:879312-Pleurochrysis_carterae.AAC.1